MNLKNSNGRAINFMHRLPIFSNIISLCVANLHSRRFHDLNIFNDVKKIHLREAMVHLARSTSAVLKAHNILMTEPAFRWPYWARICAMNPWNLASTCGGGRNWLLKMRWYKFYSFLILHHLASMASFSSGSCQVKGPQAPLFQVQC